MTRKQLVEDDASQYDSIQERLRRLEQGIPEDPHWVGSTGEPAFQSSWVNFDASPGPVGRGAFFYRHNGRVYLGGVVKSGANNTNIFTLPVAYRPLLGTGSSLFVVHASGGSAQILITTTGNVQAQNYTSSTITTWVSLEGVSFRHA